MWLSASTRRFGLPPGDRDIVTTDQDEEWKGDALVRLSLHRQQGSSLSRVPKVSIASPSYHVQPQRPHVPLNTPPVLGHRTTWKPSTPELTATNRSEPTRVKDHAPVGLQVPHLPKAIDTARAGLYRYCSTEGCIDDLCVACHRKANADPASRALNRAASTLHQLWSDKYRPPFPDCETQWATWFWLGLCQIALLTLPFPLSNQRLIRKVRFEANGETIGFR